MPNGLTVYASRDPNTANVSVQLWYKVGSKDDPAGRSGFAHLFEHLMFKATKNLPPETLDRLTEDVGGSNNAFTADDTTAYYEIVPANHLERILFSEAERMGSLVVDQAAFESERDVVKEELRQRILASPYGRLFGLYVTQEAYAEHPYRRPGIGSISDLDAATIDDVLRFHSTYYRPDNAYLIVVGDFDEAQLNGWIDRYFAPIPKPDRALPENDVKEPQRTAARSVSYYAPNVPLPAVVLNWLAPRYADEDTAALTVLDTVLSSGVSSRLYQSLVYQQQSAVEAGTQLDQLQQAGTFSVYALMANGRSVEEGERSLLAEVAKLRDAPVRGAELEEAKHELVASNLRARESLLGRGNAVGESLIMTGDPSAAQKLQERIAKVTAEDVQRAARKYLTEETRLTLRYLDAAQKPADEPAEPRQPASGAPVELSELAPAGPPVSLAPENERLPLPAAGTERPVPTPSVSERRLSTGLRVLVAPTRNIPLVSARLLFAAGSSADPANRAGLASLTASLITEGTSAKTAPQIAAASETLGASVGASAGADFTNVYANSPKDVFEQTATLMAELVKTPAFPQAELARVQQQTLDNLRVELSEPGTIADAAVRRVVYGDAPYGGPTSGTVTSVPRITRNDVVRFHRTRWRASTATLVFSGDIEPDAAFALAEKLFGEFQDARDAAAPVVNAAGAARAPRVVVIDQPGAGQAAVVAAQRGVARNDPAYYPLLVGNAVLGGGYSARLNREIRVKRGLSYGAGSSLSNNLGVGTLIADAQTRNDAAVQVADLILAEITRLGAELVTNEELATRRATLVGSFSRSLETVDGLGGLVANLSAFGLPLAELNDYAPKVRAVTPEQIREAAWRMLSASQPSLLVVGDAQLFQSELRTQYPNLESIPLTELNLDNARLR